MPKKKKKAKKRKRTIPPGDCIVISVPGRGKRKICKELNGDVRFRKMTYEPKKRRRTA